MKHLPLISNRLPFDAGTGFPYITVAIAQDGVEAISTTEKNFEVFTISHLLVFWDTRSLPMV
jgi:hypothetical protein